MRTTICCECGKEVENKCRCYKRKYCNTCLKKHMAIDFKIKRQKLVDNFTPIKKRCLVCGAVFEVTEWQKQNQKFCSPKCRKKNYKYKKRKQKKASKSVDYVVAAADIVGKSYGNFVADNYNNPDFDAYVMQIIKKNRPDLLGGKNNNEITNKKHT